LKKKNWKRKDPFLSRTWAVDIGIVLEHKSRGTFLGEGSVMVSEIASRKLFHHSNGGDYFAGGFLGENLSKKGSVSPEKCMGTGLSFFREAPWEGKKCVSSFAEGGRDFQKKSRGMKRVLLKPRKKAGADEKLFGLRSLLRREGGQKGGLLRKGRGEGGLCQ